MNTYLFTITTEPNPSDHLCNLVHRDVEVMARNDADAWGIVCDLFPTIKYPNLVGITLMNTLV
jgi:hypothetical protein